MLLAGQGARTGGLGLDRKPRVGDWPESQEREGNQEVVRAARSQQERERKRLNEELEVEELELTGQGDRPRR